MTDLPGDAPCVLFALRREALPLRRRLVPVRPLPGAPCGAWLGGAGGRPVVLLETGVGRQRTRAALEWLLDRAGGYRPPLVVAAGFCGALDGGRRVGDVVVATEVIDSRGKCWPATWTAAPPAAVPRRLVTVDRLLADAADKRELGKRHGAAVADMESAAVAERCAGAGVPFACVRAVSDDAHTALSPRLVALLAGGRVSPWRLLAHLARAPGLAGELWRLARDTKLAADRLGAALAALLGLPEHGA